MEEGYKIGRFLQRQRETRGIPLEAIAKITRISLLNLQLLENDAFHLMPAEVYTRGYLRSYAKVLKLDPEEIIKAFKRQNIHQNNS